MCDKSGHVILCAMVAVPDLMGLVLHYIDEYARTDQLIWHDGAIPDGTIVVKTCGDHGGGTFKMAFQIANHRHPHSLQNTIPFLVLEAKDSPPNLATALQPYQEQVKFLSSMQQINTAFVSYSSVIMSFKPIIMASPVVVEYIPAFTALQRKRTFSSQHQKEQAQQKCVI